MSFLGIGGRDRKNNVARELSVDENGTLNTNTVGSVIDLFRTNDPYTVNAGARHIIANGVASRKISAASIGGVFRRDSGANFKDIELIITWSTGIGGSIAYRDVIRLEPSDIDPTLCYFPEISNKSGYLQSIVLTNTASTPITLRGHSIVGYTSPSFTASELDITGQTVKAEITKSVGRDEKRDAFKVNSTSSERELTGKVIQEIIDVVGADDFACFVPFNQKNEDANEAKDIVRGKVVFEREGLGSPFFGGSGPSGHSMRITHRGLLQKAVTKNTSGTEEVRMTSPDTRLATQLNPNGSVKFATLELKRYGNLPDAKIKVLICEDDKGKPGNELKRLDISLEPHLPENALDCSRVENSWRYIGFPFKQTLPLFRRAQAPWLVLEYEDGEGVSADNCIAWRNDTSGTYGRGRSVFDGATWSSQNGQTLNFALYGDHLAATKECTVIFDTKVLTPTGADRQAFARSSQLRDDALSFWRSSERSFGFRMTTTNDVHNFGTLPFHNPFITTSYDTDWNVFTSTFSNTNRSGQFKFYKNGKLVGSQKMPSYNELLPQSQPLRIGGGIRSNGALNNQWQNTLMGNFIMINRELTHEEIAKVSALLQSLRTYKEGDLNE